MSDRTVFVGLDYHKDSVQVCVMDGSGAMRANRRCPNDWQAIVDAVRPHGIAKRVAMWLTRRPNDEAGASYRGKG